MLLLGFPLQAMAEFTVTITNTHDKAIKITPRSHHCLNDVSYFTHTVPAKSSIKVHAKWKNDKVCGMSDSPSHYDDNDIDAMVKMDYVEVCVIDDIPLENRCVTAHRHKAYDQPIRSVGPGYKHITIEQYGVTLSI